MNEEQRRAYNREQKQQRRQRLAGARDADIFADTYADRIADRIASAVLDRLRSLSAFADTEGVRGGELSAVGTHPAPKVPGVGGCPTGSADADARTRNGADADADSIAAGARAPAWDAADPRLDLDRRRPEERRAQ